jgi:hypothetical protein
VLQAPTAPVDQPLRAAESVVGSFAGVFTNSPSIPATASAATQSVTPSRANPIPNTAPFQAPASQAFSGLNNAIRTAAHQPSASVPTAPDRTGATSRATHAPSSGQDTAPVHRAHTASAAADDPAALDTLARQLYGRFSRHLAGELLIDRERSQFLTDLS